MMDGRLPFKPGSMSRNKPVMLVVENNFPSREKASSEEDKGSMINNKPKNQ